MISFSDVIDAVGVGPLAEILGIPDSHVRTLKARDSIPAGYFKRIVESDAGRTNEITFELLHGLLQGATERRDRSATASETGAAA